MFFSVIESSLRRWHAFVSMLPFPAYKIQFLNQDGSIDIYTEIVKSCNALKLEQETEPQGIH